MMGNVKPSEVELELMRHACGVEMPQPYYRNHFAATPRSDNDKIWQTLVRKGFAKVASEPSRSFVGSLRIYAVSELGMNWL